MSVFDDLLRSLGGGQYGDPSTPAMPAAPMGPGQGYTGGVIQHLQDVLSGKVAAQGALGQNNYDPNQSFAWNALNPAALAQAEEIAGGIGPGAIRRPPSPARSDLPSPNIGMGTEAPLFDYSRLTERPNMPQHMIERAPPPAKGIPDWLEAQVNDPAMREQYKQVLQLGREKASDTAALGWWNTMPLREQTIGLLGETAGDARWRSGMNMWSATSPRSGFPETVKQASYFENLLAEGKPLPELVKKYSEKNPNAFNLVPTTSGPPGYKNFPLHIQNIQNLLQPDRLTLGNQYPLTNPKPATMAQNLVGNWMQPTIDVRDLRAMGLTNKGGVAMQSVDPHTAYGYIENRFHRPLAEELSLDPAQMQSSTWLGVPEYFKGGDISGLTPALGTLEDSARRTAKALGLTPQQVIDRGWIGREFKLLSGGGLGAGLGAGLLGSGVDDDERAAF